MDLVTAKALVSATLVFAIALFSLVSLRALLVQVADDLRDAQGVGQVRRARAGGHPRDRRAR